MGTRITSNQVNGALARYHRNVEALGLLQGELSYQEGSRTNGNAYRLHVSGGQSAPGTNSGFLGWTKREAYNTLYTLCLAFEAVRYGREI